MKISNNKMMLLGLLCLGLASAPVWALDSMEAQSVGAGQTFDLSSPHSPLAQGQKGLKVAMNASSEKLQRPTAKDKNNIILAASGASVDALSAVPAPMMALEPTVPAPAPSQSSSSKLKNDVRVIAGIGFWATIGAIGGTVIGIGAGVGALTTLFLIRMSSISGHEK